MTSAPVNDEWAGKLHELLGLPGDDGLRVLLVASTEERLAGLNDRARVQLRLAHALRAETRQTRIEASALRTRAAACRRRSAKLRAKPAALILHEVASSVVETRPDGDGYSTP